MVICGVHFNMISFLGILVLYQIFSIGNTLAHDQTLITKYCEAKNVRMGTIFSCQRKRDNTKKIISLSKVGLRFLNIDINDTQNQNFPLDQLDQVLRRNYYHLAVIIDSSCIDFADFIIQDKKYFYETYHWLIPTTTQNLNKTLNFLLKAPLNINSDVNVAILNEEPNEWSILDVYNPASSHHGQFTVIKLGYCNETNGFQAKINGNKYWTRKNMSGVRFKSAVVVPDPSIKLNDYLTSEENRQLNSMHRFQSVTVNYCREMYNFSLEIQRTDSWGYLTPNGHFDGLVGLLERRLVDFGSSPLIYKLDRMPVIDYSFGNWVLRSTFIYRRPKIIEASYRIFLRPLSQTVWICIVLMMVLLMLFLKVIFSREKHNMVDSSWSFLFLFTLGAFCQQGATCHPQLLSSRTLSVFIFLFCILTYQFYSASIVSYLLIDPPRKINNLKDLSDSNLRVGIEDILIDRNYFVQTTDPIAIELFNKKIIYGNNNSGFYEPWEGLDLVKQGGFAFHVETSTAYPIIEETFTNEEICELEEVQMYRTQPMHTNLQKNSPFREMMNYCMLHLVENGIMDRLRKYWDARKPMCIESAKKFTFNVGLKEFSSGLIVLSYGVLFSLVLLLRERIAYKKEYIRGLFRKKNVVQPFTN
ncbi:ionotropic receptor 75a-like [Tribolium madens]|uniref:ionotropic receptor 75a-like n=1 Tax=Tribolium madens TaxID=41895 RepID=UPI001CF74072|nr:ionotropic receptor 75a-like [Tribolium madens]